MSSNDSKLFDRTFRYGEHVGAMNLLKQLPSLGIPPHQIQKLKQHTVQRWQRWLAQNKGQRHG